MKWPDQGFFFFFFPLCMLSWEREERERECWELDIPTTEFKGFRTCSSLFKILNRSHPSFISKYKASASTFWRQSTNSLVIWKACLCLCSGKESKDSVIWKMTRLNREDQGLQAHNWTPPINKSKRFSLII